MPLCYQQDLYFDVILQLGKTHHVIPPTYCIHLYIAIRMYGKRHSHSPLGVHIFIAWNGTTLDNCCTCVTIHQVHVAVHCHLLVGAVRKVYGVPHKQGWISHYSAVTDPLHSKHILHTLILTPVGDATSSTHIRGIWVGLSEDHWTCTNSNSMKTNWIDTAWA